MARSVAGWRAWYTGERVYSAAETDWLDLPDDGLLVLMLYYDEFSRSGVRYRLSLSGQDWYFHVPGTDTFGSNSDPIEENRERYPDAVFKRGKWAGVARFDEVRREAMDSTWP